MIEYFLILAVAFGCTALRRSLIPPPQFDADYTGYIGKSNSEAKEVEEVVTNSSSNSLTKREEWASRTVGLLHAMLLAVTGTMTMFTGDSSKSLESLWTSIIFSFIVGYFVYDSVLQFVAIKKSPLKSFAAITHHVISTFILAGYFFIPANIACRIFCVGEWAVVFIALLWRTRQPTISLQSPTTIANTRLIRLLRLLIKFSYCVRVLFFALGFLWYGAGNIASALLQLSTYPKLVGVVFIFALNTLWLLDILTDGSPTGLLSSLLATVLLRVVGIRNLAKLAKLSAVANYFNLQTSKSKKSARPRSR